MKPAELTKQEQALSTFEELEREMTFLNDKVGSLGWKQRDELIRHVYSNYNNHEGLNIARSEWKTELTKLNAVSWLYKIFSENRDLFGYFENYDKIMNEIDELIECAASMEKYEIASTLLAWKKKFP